ncbi:hypothetical protein IC175_17385 [Clostridioides sp. ES-S-0123-01]|uniref:DUF6054 family protein n=1 Tax=Clostridioides sp. ES-S-0123-01 TaxID=2770783 RepID=UPI001D0FB3D3|nr:hypothetical protein [Clostridioides sp. ES-S-0123-01]
MAKEVFTVKMTPLEAHNIIKENFDADLVSVDIYNLKNDKSIIVTIFEKYYARSNSDAGLVVICENITGKTLVKITSTGSAIGLFKIDWGTGDNLIKRIKKILIDYII